MPFRVAAIGCLFLCLGSVYITVVRHTMYLVPVELALSVVILWSADRPQAK
jgi:hypothetical protein